jgi:hypothetical protein
MIEGKEEGFARKRKLRDKANLRFLKQKHFILPGIWGAMFIGFLMGGSIALTISPALIPLGALLGTWAAALALGIYILQDLQK